MRRYIQRRPLDPHWHLRQGQSTVTALLQVAVGQFAVIFAEPNTEPAILTALDLEGYRDVIKSVCPRGVKVRLIIQITERTTAKMIYAAKEAGAVAGKVYPWKVTNNSENGVRDYKNIDEALDACQNVRLPVQFHDETPCREQASSARIARLGCFGKFKGLNPDNFPTMERSRRFVGTDRDRDGFSDFHDLVMSFPRLPISLEHINTVEEVRYIEHAPSNVMGGIAPHYMVHSQDDLLAWGDLSLLMPAIACKPAYKTPEDVQAVLSAALSGNPQFGLSSDFAWHDVTKKSKPTGCSSGNCTGPVLMQSLVQIFDAYDALDRLEPFTTSHFANHYGIELPDETLELERRPHKVEAELAVGDGKGVVWLGGETLDWSIVR